MSWLVPSLGTFTTVRRSPKKTKNSFSSMWLKMSLCADVERCYAAFIPYSRCYRQQPTVYVTLWHRTDLPLISMRSDEFQTPDTSIVHAASSVVCGCLSRMFWCYRRTSRARNGFLPESST
jgi:hypothetical protein